MKQLARYTVFAIVLGLTACLGKCSDKKADGTTQSGASSGQTNAASESLILAAKEQGAFLPPELADSRYADESTLPMEPFALPAANFANATMEVEPDNTAATATPIGSSQSAKGEIHLGDYDYYSFESTGDPQLWAIEAVGRSVSNIMFYGGGSQGTGAQRLDSTRLVIPNLYLTAGKHTVQVVAASGLSGPYTLRAVPLGKPDLRMEQEPNDEVTQAHPLRAGIPRVGMLLDRNDRDGYGFALTESAHVLLQVTSPPDIAITVTLSPTTGTPHTFLAKTPGENAHFDMTLPAGEYVATVRGVNAGSLKPYKLRLDLPDPFALPVDREPNNLPDEASPLPSDLVLRGTVGEFSDPDWYAIPLLTQATTMRMQVVSLSPGMDPQNSIRVSNRTGGRDAFLSWTKKETAWEMQLPANAPVFIQLVGRGDYQLGLSFTPGLVVTPGKGAFTVSLPAGPHLVEAFSTMSQTQSLPVTVHNPGTQRIEVALDAVVSNSGWTVKPNHQVVTVEAGKDTQVPLQVDLPPDAAAGDAVQVAVRASSAGGMASATTKMYALCAATPANPKEFSALPPTMLGGLNVASGSLGAHPVETNANLITRQMMLYDGMTPSDAGWAGDRQSQSGDSALTLTVALAGSRSAKLTGVTLIPGNGNPDQQIDQFDILVSDDGQTYQKVLSGRLRTARMEQAFAFPAPVQARFARMHIVTNQGGKMGNRSVLGEFKVIDAPGEIPLDSALNIADPRVGGHVVWSQPLFSVLNASLTSAADAPLEKLDPSLPNEWVVGFNQDRAAQISRLEWVQPSQPVATAKVLTAVEVSVSTESPVGPWTSIGSWKISAIPGSVTPLDLAQPAWARFIRFSTTEPKKATEYWRRAETIRILERPADATYRSILAEWGHYSRSGIYEQMVKPPVVSDAGVVTGNGKRDDAKKIESGKSYRGIVALQSDEDWYRIDIPSGQNRLKLNLQGDPTFRAVASLQDESGKTIPSESSPGMAGITRVDALVEGGKTYYLRLVEPPRSIALVFDNSSSIRNYTVAIFRALARFVQAVQPKMEFANVLPLMNKPKFLLDNWSDQPYVLQAALQQYDQSDASSNSERGLLAATEALERREGSSKAILLLTDAATDGYASTSDLWAAFGRVLPRVFTLELQLGNLVQPQQHLMQDWSSAGDGYYSSFKTVQDLDTSFDRMSCYLRRPVRYTLTLETRFEEALSPGGLEVTMAPEAVADNAVEIILDASGSMLQMLGGRRKMDIARSTLVELVEKTLPDKTPFAFRAFGTRIANCESDLLLNVQPLDRVKVGAMVRKLNATNLAKTPLGASLLAVGQDLKNVKGQKVVVLLTDGEETCGGDPAQAIQALKTQGLDLRINVVGFDVADAGLKVSFERWATLGGGRYFDAKNGQELSKALTDALRPKFQVTDVTGEVVAEGTVGGARVSLPVGTYTVRVLTSPVKTYERVHIGSKQTQSIAVK